MTDMMRLLLHKMYSILISVIYDISQLNPQHTIPTLVDDDFAIWDSHAIAAYLVTKYGQDDSLYPTEVHQRALVDQRLHFDCGTLFKRAIALLVSFFTLFLFPLMFHLISIRYKHQKRLAFDLCFFQQRPIIRGLSNELNETDLQELYEAFEFMEAFLKDREWMAGDSLTIADLCLVPCVASVDLVVPVDEEKYPRLYAWYQRCKELPYFEESNREGLDAAKELFDANLGQQL